MRPPFWRYSNVAAILGNLLNIKPILRFDDSGKSLSTKRFGQVKAFKKLYKILADTTKTGDYKVYVIHANVPETAQEVAKELTEKGI